MTTVARRRENPVTDLLSWLESEPSFTFPGMGLTPRVRIEDYVEDNEYRVRAELPGIDPDKDVVVEVTDDVLSIRGERKEEHQERNRHEFHYGSFERRVRLPRGARTGEVSASYTDGVLEVRVPCDAEAPGSTTVPIARAGS